MIPRTTHPVVDQEVTEAFNYYEQVAAGLGQRFLDALEVTVVRIRSFPGLYAADATGYRIAPIDGFPYQVVYVDATSHVWIVSVTHARRRPGHWASRRPGDV